MGKASRRQKRKLDRRIERDPIGVLHEEVSFRSRDDAMAFIAAASRHTEPGYLTLAFCDADHRLVDLLVVTDGDRGDVKTLVALVCGVVTVDAVGLLMVSDRTGEIPADRPHDELLWLELVQVAKNERITLYDWMVTWGTKAFSIAEFAPISAQWAV